MKKDTAQVIFRTVVVAGAMLGAGACAGKKTQNTTINNTTVTEPGSGDPAAGSAMDPATDPDSDASDPCGGDARARGGDDEGGGEGRGFILS